MKILHTVEQYLPTRNGMQEVVTQLSERLAARGHDVTIATTKDSRRTSSVINGVKIREFEVSGSEVDGYRGNTQSFVDFLLTEKFDIITNFAAHLWATDLTLPLLSQLQAKKVFVPTGFSTLKIEKYRSYYDKMGERMKRYDLNVFLSNDYYDINFAREHGIDKYVVIPNGASEKDFALPLDQAAKHTFRKKNGVREKDTLILMVGAFTGLKGHLQAMKIMEKVKVQDCTLLLAGSKYSIGTGFSANIKNIMRFVLSPVIKVFPVGDKYYRLLAMLYNLRIKARGRNNKIVFKILDRNEIIAAFKTADIFLFPSMIECSPIVLFESIASKTPFLSTDVGNVKEIIEWTNGGILLPTIHDSNGLSHALISESAEVVNDMVNNKSKRKSLAEDGYNSFQQRFTWENIALQYEEIYSRLLVKETNTI